VPALVSIVTPCFNAEQFLEETLASVLAQTYPHWEVLLVDDGSRDRTAEMAARWASRHSERARLLRHEDGRNRGTSESRNLGIRHARGEYLAFLDADDIWLPGHLGMQLDLLERHPNVGLVYGPTEEWYGWTGQAADEARNHIPELKVPTDQVLSPPGPLAAFVRRDAPTPCTCSVVVRRSAAQAVGGFEPIFTGMYDDQVLYAKLCLSAPVLASPTCSSRYRRHRDSLYSRAKATGQSVPDRRAFLLWLDGYLSAQRRPTAELERVVARELYAARHPRLARFLSRFSRGA